MKWREDVLKQVFDNFFPGEKFGMVLDIGGGQSEVKNVLRPGKYVNVNKREYSGDHGEVLKVKSYKYATPDIKCDLNKVKKFPLKNRSCDLVVLSQILEHLNFDATWTVSGESKRVSKKYIVVGLPNDMAYYQRLRMLVGVPIIGVTEFGHHYLFNVDLAEKFVKERFEPEFKIVKKYNVVRGPLRRLPMSGMLPSIHENLFTSEVYYLLKRK
jgi:hypothetical protein